MDKEEQTLDEFREEKRKKESPNDGNAKPTLRNKGKARSYSRKGVY